MSNQEKNNPSINRQDYEVVIGMEVHAQLLTKSKIFCSCANTQSEIPNVNICPVCTGQPGTLPVLNEEVVKAAIKAGLGTRSRITSKSRFARKHYFYPDLPKGYQITQSDLPICTEGKITIRLENGEKKDIRLIRIHMEEDAGKNIHSQFTDESYIDLNRAGTPLLEMVSYPDISSSYETREYLKELRLIVQYLGICSGNMEEGAFRADTNISVRPKGQKELGTKCELKNINSFKFISDAIEYEINRQISVLAGGGKVKQETRLWDPKEKKTIVMRSKEEAADYRYFNDPDLPLIELSDQTIEDIRKNLPELPAEKLEKLMTQAGLSFYEADVLVNNAEVSNYFEEIWKITQSKQVINWILRDLLGYLKDQKISLDQYKPTPNQFAQLIELLDNRTINNRSAQEVFSIMSKIGKNPIDIVKDLNLEQVGSEEEIEQIVKEIIANNPAQVNAYRSGKDRLFGFFVGQALQKTQGKGDPKLINELFKKYL